MTPTIEQVLKTFILAIHIYEVKKKGHGLKLWQFVVVFLFIPVLIGVQYLIFHNSTLIFDSTGYPVDLFDFLTRFVWSGIYIILILTFPKVKEVAE